MQQQQPPDDSAQPLADSPQHHTPRRQLAHARLPSNAPPLNYTPQAYQQQQQQQSYTALVSGYFPPDIEGPTVITSKQNQDITLSYKKVSYKYTRC